MRDNTSEGGWKFPLLHLHGYDPNKPRYFDDERVDVLLYGWKNYVATRYGKEMNSLGMSAIMQNQVRKAYREGDFSKFLKVKPTHTVGAVKTLSAAKVDRILEDVVCKSIEALLEFAETHELKDRMNEVLYCAR